MSYVKNFLAFNFQKNCFTSGVLSSHGHVLRFISSTGPTRRVADFQRKLIHKLLLWGGVNGNEVDDEGKVATRGLQDDDDRETIPYLNRGSGFARIPYYN